MKSIKFSCGFSDENVLGEKRTGAVSGDTITLYLTELLNGAGYRVELISATKTIDGGKHSQGKTVRMGNNSLIVSPAIGGRGKLIKAFKALYQNLWLLFYLIKNTQRREKILLYHTISEIPALLLAKKLKKLVFIDYVGEIYHQVSHHSKMNIFLENRILSKVDRYIFSSPLLNEKINLTGKPSMIMYGAFTNTPVYSTETHEGIKVVYAGIINENKGAFTLCDVSKYLDAHYSIHIIGFGEEEDIKKLQDKISIINQESECQVVFDGLLKGTEYQKYLQGCDIGICPQITDEAYNSVSFPSKISVYMSNGLNVLVPDIPVMRHSSMKQYFNYFQEYAPYEIAMSLKNITLKSSCEIRKLIDELGRQTLISLENLIND